MGREIRRVPLDWKHPKQMRERILNFNLPMQKMPRYGMVEEFVPLYKWSYTDAVEEWDRENTKWMEGTHPDYPNRSYAEYAGTRPDPSWYMPEWSEEECKGWCVYETVSEGTPVTPVFENPEDLIDYLVKNGDFWDQERRKEGRSRINCDPWSREVATRFVMSTGWAPSLALTEDGVKRGQEVT